MEVKDTIKVTLSKSKLVQNINRTIYYIEQSFDIDAELEDKLDSIKNFFAKDTEDIEQLVRFDKELTDIKTRLNSM